MNKQEFITLLEKRLFELPQVEKEHLLNYYNETIEDRIDLLVVIGRPHE